ncbi:MAG: TonB-dependent receptor [Bacteroidales bacterium]
MKRKATFFVMMMALMLLVAPQFVVAQGTVGAAFNGVVTDAEGETLPGATVIAVHIPSGTEYGTVTRADGRFNLRNLRVGGPYTVKVTFVGYRAAEETGINLELGQDYTINFELVDEAVELGMVAVYAQRDALISGDRTGASSRVSREQLDALPSINRSIQDFTRLSPQVSGNNIAGRSGRRNAIQIDGVTFDDRFGLGSDAIPTIGNPISLDAIEEFQVAISPFDVREGNFTGGSINAVTRSGTNDLEGSAYFFGRNQELVSGDLMGEERPIDDFDEYQTGLRLGGPIVENELFFFVNAEVKRENSPIFDYEGAQFRGERAALDEIISIARDKWGYDPGGYDRMSQRTDDWKIFTKLDWNISNVHRLTYQQNLVNGYDDRGISRGFNSFSLSNRQYRQRGNQSNFSLRLNSAWSENLISEVKVAYTRLRQEADYGDNPFPSVRVETPGGYNVDFGVERFRHANQLDQDYVEFTANMTYFTGDHTLTFGTNNYLNSFRNLFIQDALGTYTFSNIYDENDDLVQSGIDRFEMGAPNRYQYSYSTDVDAYGRLPEANWGYNTFAVYTQDEWRINQEFTMTLGVRADLVVFTDDPPSNPTFAQDFSGYDTSEVPDPTLQLNPRLGFNWNDGETQVRGGIGLFSGGEPGVWLSNQYSNTGVDVARLDERNTFDAGFFSPDTDNQPLPGGDANGLDPIETSEVNITDPDFKINQILRSNLGLEQRLPWDLVGTVELIYSNNLHDIDYQNLNLGQANPNVVTTDGRPFFGDVEIDEDGNAHFDQTRVSNNFTNVLLLTNTNEGHQYSITGQLRKEFSSGWFADLSYTFADGTSVNDGTSSRAISNWQYNEVPGDPNNSPAYRSIHITRHRVLGIASYQLQYGRQSTTFSLIYEGRSGRPYHYIHYTPFFYGYSANGDYRGSNDLVYVPNSPDEVNLVSNNWEELDAFISANPGLDDFRGEITERGADIQPWVNHIDFRVSHQIRTTGTQSIEITFDILNFNNMIGNLFGQNWGIERVASYGTVSEITFEGYDATELDDGTIELKPRISFDPDRVPTNEDQYSLQNLSSRWRAQIGIRYNL